MLLKIDKISCGYPMPGKNYKKVLENFSLTVNNGEIHCILGKNGAGKSTLFKTLLGGLPLLEGEILLNGRPLRSMRKKELAAAIAYVPQNHTPPFAFTVREIVLMGRNVYVSSFGEPSKKDVEIAEEMLSRLHITHLADKKYTRISGGERQLALIARAMAQKPQIMLMDEPTANLDYGNQMRILQEILRLSSEGISIIFTSHQPEQSLLCGSQVTAIKGRDNFTTGTAEEVITEELLYELYGVHTKIWKGTDRQKQNMHAIAPVFCK